MTEFLIPCILSPQYFTLPKEDYLLGLSDVTGELMRYAISGIAQKGGRTRAREVCTFVRQCKAGKSIDMTRGVQR